MYMFMNSENCIYHNMYSSISVFCISVSKMSCQCRNLNCQTGEYKYREKKMVTIIYCQTVNCRTIEMSDCEV